MNLRETTKYKRGWLWAAALTLGLGSGCGGGDDDDGDDGAGDGDAATAGDDGVSSADGNGDGAPAQGCTQDSDCPGGECVASRAACVEACVMEGASQAECDVICAMFPDDPSGEPATCMPVGGDDGSPAIMCVSDDDCPRYETCPSIACEPDPSCTMNAVPADQGMENCTDNIGDPDNSQCQANVCIEFDGPDFIGDGYCSMYCGCNDDCPGGWTCQQVARLGVNRVCVDPQRPSID
jgi:hypothetical protein